MIWNIVSHPYGPELRITGICMMDVATAKKRSTRFVFFRKNARQSGNEMAKRRIISTSKMIVATVSVIPTLLWGKQDCALNRLADLGDIFAVLNAWMVRSAAMRAIQIIFVLLYHCCAWDNGRR